jgi:Zn-dependent peptidase ImmA (M78 family)/transcriptional regulator with XRE-family HTH domain
MQSTIAKRLKAAREEAGLTQQQLSDALGFKDRQTVAAIEAGIRKISAEELMKAMNILGKDLEYFTDPFRLDGEGSFSWRSSPDVEDRLGDFEQRAGAWLALYRGLAHDAGRTSPLSLSLTAKSSYEDAHNAADWLRSEWQLGDVPAQQLGAAIGTRLRALVLHVDAPHGISGAAFRLPEFNAILINRSEPLGRRSFDLAHELFHLLTWETIRPAHTESGMLNAKGRPEQLANCFASALLMPERVIRGWLDQVPTFPHKDRKFWQTWLNDRAYELRVSTPALQWRMVQLGLLPKSDVDNELDWIGEHETETPPAFSEEYMRTLARGLESGKVSVRKVASLLGLTIDELGDLFRGYRIDVPFDI